MNPIVTSVTPLDLKNAREREYQALHRFTTRLRAELLPDDPPTPLEAAIHSWRNPSPLATTSTWIAWQDDGERVVGRGQLMLPTSGANEHLGQATIDVLPEARRQHVGRSLLAAIATGRPARASWRNCRPRPVSRPTRVNS